MEMDDWQKLPEVLPSQTNLVTSSGIVGEAAKEGDEMETDDESGDESDEMEDDENEGQLPNRY